MSFRDVTVIIPAYNEERTIGGVVRELRKYGCSVLVIDDGSCDGTADVARKAGAEVVLHCGKKGYLEALRTGFRLAKGSVFVTMDADGQHDPRDFPRLVKPILEGKADMVIGVRDRLSSFSEWLITVLTMFRVNVSDASSGFKALRRELASRMELNGRCVCGTFVLEAARLGARIWEVRIKTGKRKFGKSKVMKRHLVQMFFVIRELLRKGYGRRFFLL